VRQLVAGWAGRCHGESLSLSTFMSVAVAATSSVVIKIPGNPGGRNAVGAVLGTTPSRLRPFHALGPKVNCRTFGFEASTPVIRYRRGLFAGRTPIKGPDDAHQRRGGVLRLSGDHHALRYGRCLINLRAMVVRICHLPGRH
jgi:hypothetical protein